MCGLITNASSPLAGLAAWVTQSVGPDCWDASYAAMITQLKNTTLNTAANMRQWTYQTCSEFGYYQTSGGNATASPFTKGNLFPLSFYEQMCNDAFSKTFNVEANVANTNSKFGGNALPSWGARNVAWDNSVVDPWHTLSVQSSPNAESPLFMYEVRGHCAAVSPPKPSDPESIKQVRANIATSLNKWVAL